MSAAATSLLPTLTDTLAKAHAETVERCNAAQTSVADVFADLDRHERAALPRALREALDAQAAALDAHGKAYTAWERALLRESA